MLFECNRTKANDYSANVKRKIKKIRLWNALSNKSAMTKILRGPGVKLFQLQVDKKITIYMEYPH